MTGESVRADRKILFDLYERFGRVTRSYLIHALREERKAISIDIWARAAQSMVNNLRDTLASEEDQSVGSPGSLREIRRKMKSLLENEREDLETRELDLLVANTSRAIINAWDDGP